MMMTKVIKILKIKTLNHEPCCQIPWKLTKRQSKANSELNGTKHGSAVVECKFLYVFRFQNADSYFYNFNDRLNSA